MTILRNGNTSENIYYSTPNLILSHPVYMIMYIQLLIITKFYCHEKIDARRTYYSLMKWQRIRP